MAHWYDRYLGKGSRSQTHSSFWSDEFDFDADDYKSVLSESQIDTLKKYRLSSGRKAISNFVTIATGKNIPVSFSTGKESYTDGKRVVISGDIDDAKKFDVGVGLALHEGSHILLSDFKFLEELFVGYKHITDEDIDKGYKVGIGDPRGYIKNILNVVEDRRIDNYIYKSAPGYREYYLKLYNTYFGDKVITEALKSDQWKSETPENYMSRLINIMNPASDLTSLKAMRKIWDVLNLHNIGRLTSTQDAFEVAIKIYRIIVETLQSRPFDKNNPQSQQQQQQSGNGGEGDQTQGGGEGDDDEDGDGSAGQIDAEGDGEEDSRGGASISADGGDGKDSKLSDAKQKKLEKILSQQKDFLNGKTKKKKVSAQMQKEIAAVEDSGAELSRVGESVQTRWGAPQKGIDVVVYKKLTQQMLDSESIEMYQAHTDYRTKVKTPRLVIPADKFAAGERMGTILGKKLQVRNEARMTVFNRQRNGSIDKRLVHSLGFDAESVFTQIHIDKFKKANIHLSIDASSSMCGTKWEKTMINTIAIAKAVSMIQNLTMQISFRYTNSDNLPVVLIAWDSRKESYQKIRSIFPYLNASGTTPEGLCFEAIRKLVIPATNDLDSYFVNISDGEPCFSGKSFEYNGEPAYEHTKKEVEKFRKDGIVFLSYFISHVKNAEHTVSGDAFRKMYGKDARYIDITNVGEVTTTLNKMFLSK